MKRFIPPSFQTTFFSIAGLVMLLLLAACAGVPSAPGTTTGNGVTTNNGQGQHVDGPPAAGSISFVGQVQSVSSSSISVGMPNGQALTAKIVSGQTDLSDLNGVLPTQGQMVKLEATVNTSDGSFTATELKAFDAGDTEDQNTVTFTGMTTAAVGADNVVHVRIGTQDFNFTLNTSTEIKGFNGAQSIANNQAIEVTVQYQGSNVTVLEVKNPND